MKPSYQFTLAIIFPNQINPSYSAGCLTWLYAMSLTLTIFVNLLFAHQLLAFQLGWTHLTHLQFQNHLFCEHRETTWGCKINSVEQVVHVADKCLAVKMTESVWRACMYCNSPWMRWKTIVGHQYLEVQSNINSGSFLIKIRDYV